MPLERLPYFVEQDLQALHNMRHLILAGATAPVAFFTYPNAPSSAVPETTQIHELARPAHDLEDVLARLADALGATTPAGTQTLQRAVLPTGELKPSIIAQSVSALLPEGCIVVDEGNTSSLSPFLATMGAPPHDWLTLTGGSIGDGMPMAVGAAIACPDRRVLNLQADGSAAYMLQALWTQVHEGLDVTTVIYANRSYRILTIEYARTGAGQQPGPQAQRLLSQTPPEIEWTNVAQSMGVPAVRVTSAEEFSRALAAYVQEPGPNLIEAVV